MKEKRARVTIPAKEVVRELLTLAGERSRWVVVRHRSGGVWKTHELDVLETGHEGGTDATTAAVLALKRKYGVPPGSELPDWRIESWQTAAWVRPFLALLSFGGLRIGEARGMRWTSIDWRLSTMRVDNAVDRFNEVGELKTEAATRTVKMGPLLRNTLRAWFEACGEPEDGYLFPSVAGTPISYANIANRQLGPLWVRLAHAKPELRVLKPDGTPRISPHHLRHFAVSLWAEQGKKAEEISKLVGHADVTVTLRIYWHLFEKQVTEAEDEQLAAAELAVMGSRA
jgi:integrase